MKVLKKGISLYETEQVFKETKAAGIQVLAYFMIGAMIGFPRKTWKKFTLDEPNGLLVEGYRRFYRRPGDIARRLAGVRSLDELVEKIRADLKIITMRSKTGPRR